MNTFGQAQNRTWVIPDKLLSFNPGATVSTLPTPYIATAGYNAMQDANGNLLFYIIDGYIYDAYGNEINFINNNQNPGYAVKGYPEVCIVPVPGSCTKYYIIAAEATIFTSTSTNPSTFYVTLDMSLPNPNVTGAYGALVGPNSTEIVFGANSALHAKAMHMAVSKLRTSTNDRLLFVCDNSSLFRLTINSTGIGGLINLGSLSCGYNSSALKSEMELFEDASGNYKLANIGMCSNPKLEIYSLNSSGNLVGSPSSVLITPSGGTNGDPHGLEFSPNGQYIYITTTQSPYIEYVNVSTMAISTLSQVTNAIDFKESQIELGYDGKMYFAAANRLATLTGANNPTTATWQNSVLSLTIPSVSFVYSSETQTLRVLQDQIDGENYNSVPNATAQCCDYNSLWNKINFTSSTGTATWNSTTNPLNGSGVTAKIKGTLTIPSGANITIQGMTLKFGLDGKITIQPGGKLTINNVTLTGNSACQNMWQGVEVLGSGQSGLPNTFQQGQFISLNNCLIEQAITGVINSSFNTSQANYFGGYVSCAQTIFNNCQYGVRMNSHNSNSNYTSLIQSCSFTSSSLWYPNAGTRSVTHVALYDVRGGSSATAGVDIILSATSPHSTFNNADYGISCLDDQNINLQFLDFTNCGKGVSSARAFTTLNTGSVISNLTFNGCYTSINMANSKGDIVSNNFFNSNNASQNTNFYGIYTDGSSDFHITDNTFKRIMYGIYCNNSGSVGGRISSNSGSGNIFRECWRGIDCRGDNQNLQIKCNQFFNITQPASEFSTAWYVGGDLPDQGSVGCPTCPAANEFFRSGSRKDIYSQPGVNSCLTFNFCYYRNSLPMSCIPLIYTPTAVNVDNTNIAKSSSSCVGQGLMAQSGNNPEDTKDAIDQETDPVKQQLWINELVAWYQEQFMNEDAKAYLESRYDDAAKKMLLPLYIANNEVNKARDILNYYCSQEDDESKAYCQLNSIILDWTIDSISPYEMSESQKTVITEVANGLTNSSAQAQTILKRVFDETIEPWVPSDSSTERLAQPFEEPIGLSLFELYPNPVKDGSVLISANVEGEVDSYATVRVYSALGILFSEEQFQISSDNTILFPVSMLSDGVYFVELVLKNYPQEFRKLLVQRN